MARGAGSRQPSHCPVGLWLVLAATPLASRNLTQMHPGALSGALALTTPHRSAHVALAHWALVPQDALGHCVSLIHSHGNLTIRFARHSYLPQDALEQYSSPFCSLMPPPGLSEFPAIIAHPELHPEAARAALSAAMAAREALESGEELHPLADTPTVVG